MALRIKLTKAAIARMDLDRDGQWVTDAEVPQLLVRITKTSKTFVARWTSPKDGSRKQETIGSVEEVSVTEARNRARALVAGDRQRSVETLADVYDVWDKHHSSKVSDGHAEEIRRTWRKHIGPELGNKKLARITNRVLQEWYDKKRLEHPLTPKGKMQAQPNSAATVNRWIAYISKFLSIARQNGWMAGNPVEGLERSDANRRLDVFTKQDVRDLSEALIAHRDRFPIGVDLIRFLLLYPCRGIEAREMEWADLDLDAGTWTIPAARYKTKKAKSFPLGRLQVEHLRNIPKRSDRYVFPMVTDITRPVAKSHQRHVWEALRPKPLGIHALRKTIATSMVNNQMPLEMVSLILGHSSTLVTQQAYAHLDPQAARKHLETWTLFEEDFEETPKDYIDDVLEGQKLMAIAAANKE